MKNCFNLELTKYLLVQWKPWLQLNLVLAPVQKMNKIFSSPNLAITLAFFTWLIAYYAGLIAIGDLKPADPNSTDDIQRYEEQIHQKDIFIKAVLIISVIFSLCPYVLAIRGWKNARIRYSISVLICSSYLGLAFYYVLTT